METDTKAQVPGAYQAVPRESFSNGACEGALIAAGELSKIGTKNKDLRKRLVRLMIWLRTVLQEYDAEKDIILATWAKRDPDTNEIITEEIDGGKATRIIMRNEIEAQLAGNQLRRQRARSEENPPEPFTMSELDAHFVKVVDKKEVPAVSPEMMSRLGPFLVLE